MIGASSMIASVSAGQREVVQCGAEAPPMSPASRLSIVRKPVT